MAEDQELRVPTVPVRVELALVGRAAEAVEVFLADVPRTGRSHLARDVVALLEDHAPFFPARAGDQVALCARAAVAWVALATVSTAGGGEGGDAVPEEVQGVEPSEVLDLYDHRHDLRVELTGGAAVEGHVFDSSPIEQQRLADHLNRAGRFLWVWRETTLYLINTHHVVRVVER